LVFLLLTCFGIAVISPVVVFWQIYMNEMANGSNQLPVGIAGREDVIFGNIVEILEFHKKSVDFLWHISFKSMCI